MNISQATMPTGLTRPSPWTRRYSPPDEDVGEELQRDQQRQHRAVHARGHRLVLEVGEQPALRLDPRNVVDQPADQHQPVDEPGAGEGRELEERDRGEQVVQQHEEEQREQERHEPHEVLAADDVATELVANEAVTQLADVLQLARHHLTLRRGGAEEHEDEHSAQDDHQHRLGDAEVHLLAEEREGVVGPDRRQVEVTRPRGRVALARGEEHRGEAHCNSCVVTFFVEACVSVGSGSRLNRDQVM
jgi:hypothetical protein